MPPTIDLHELPGDEERSLLRASLRGLLQAQWPAESALARSAEPGAVAALWHSLVGQGLAELGHDPAQGGLREIVVAMEELGRAACPAPLAGGCLLNLLARTGTLDPQDPLVQALHRGQARVVAACAGLVGDTGSGSLHLDGGAAHGTLSFVDAGMHASHVLALAADRPGHEQLVVVDATAGAVQALPQRALGLDGHAGWAELQLRGATARVLAPGPAESAQVSRLLRLMLLARAHGAARRAFELAVDWARERRQFGQPIGRFQAIQHKLADNLIALEGVRLTLMHATRAWDLCQHDAPHFASAAVAFGAASLRQVALQTHHALGAIGYAEEHEAPRHFRRVHLDLLALGGAAQARRELAARLLDAPDGALPEYDLGAAGNALRHEVRQWLQENWSGPRKATFDSLPFHDRAFDADFARALGRTGWIGLAWPRAFGGQERTPLEQIGYAEVMERAEAPRFGAAVQANALIMHGTPEQQARYLPEILRGQAMHGMGYSEPEAGSDLASLRTRATRDGSHWVINGQKIWTTTWWGTYMFLAARTDPEARPPQAGISMFIVPMDTPGITVKPARTMYDGSFANIFYDDVRIPLENIVGPVNGGWKVLTDALANERGSVGGGIALKVAHAFNLLLQDVRSDPALCVDALARDRLGQLAAEIEVGRQLMVHCAELATGGTTPPEMGAISKVYSGELMERFGEAALDILGPRAALSQEAPGALRGGRYEQNLRHSLMWVISIGTNEIQRSLIAQRGLGLPR